MTGSPYLDRVLFLFVFFLVAGVVDKFINGRAANRWKEYLFLVICGIVGTLAGILHDQVTVSISPDYYRLAKEISTPNLRWGAVLLGSKTGFTAGVVLSGIFLFASKGRMTGPIPLRHLKFVCTYTVVFACIGAALGGFIVPDSWVSFYEVPAESASQFKIVVAEHYGLYLGALTGTVLGIRNLRLTLL